MNIIFVLITAIKETPLLRGHAATVLRVPNAILTSIVYHFLSKSEFATSTVQADQVYIHIFLISGQISKPSMRN